MKLELDNFFLAEYDPKNVDHKTTIIELENDEGGRKYLGDLEYHIELVNERYQENRCNHAFIAYYGEEEDPSGFISITGKDDAYQISYGIRPKYRGEYLGALLLQEFSEKMFEIYPEIDDLTLVINNLNTASRKTADLAGYTQEDRVSYTQKRR